MSKWTLEMETRASDLLDGDDAVGLFEAAPDLLRAAIVEIRRLRDTVKTLSVALDLARTRQEGG